MSGRTPHPTPGAPPPTLFVRERGTGEPLVLLHGLASSGRYWGDLMPLAERRRVLAPDLLGFGRSPKPPKGEYTAADHLAALRPALHERIDGPFDLLGHSLGSLIALHYAVMHPEDVRTLVLVSLPVVGRCAWGHGTDGAMTRWHRFSVHSMAGNALFGLGMRAAAPVWANVGPRLRRGEPPDAVRDALAGTWTSYWRSLEAVVYGTDVPSLIERLQAPVRLIHGSADPVAPVSAARELAAAHPAVPYIEITGAAHNPFFTHKDAFVCAVESALAAN